MPAVEHSSTLKRSSSARSPRTIRPKSASELSSNGMRLSSSSSRLNKNRSYNVRTLSGFLLQYDEEESNILDTTHSYTKLKAPSSSSHFDKRMNGRKFSEFLLQYDENNKPDTKGTSTQHDHKEKSVEIVKELSFLKSLSPSSSIKYVRFTLEQLPPVILSSLTSTEIIITRPSTSPERKPMSPRIYKLERRPSVNLPTIPENAMLPPILK